MSSTAWPLLFGFATGLVPHPIVPLPASRPPVGPAALPQLPEPLSVTTVRIDAEDLGEGALVMRSDGLGEVSPAAIGSEDHGSRATTARVSLALVAATYGSNYACVKLLDEWVGEPSVASCLRFAVAFAVMLPALGYCGSRDARYLQWPFARDGLVIGSWFAAGYCAQVAPCLLNPRPRHASALAVR